MKEIEGLKFKKRLKIHSEVKHVINEPLNREDNQPLWGFTLCRLKNNVSVGVNGHVSLFFHWFS